MDRAGLQETRTSIKTRPRSTDLTWLGGQSAPFYHCPGPDRLLFGQDCAGAARRVHGHGVGRARPPARPSPSSSCSLVLACCWAGCLRPGAQRREAIIAAAGAPRGGRRAWRPAVRAAPLVSDMDPKWRRRIDLLCPLPVIKLGRCMAPPSYGKMQTFFFDKADYC
jgi:hypothetical protein